MKIEPSDYDKFYLSGGFQYDAEWGRKFILERTELALGSGTLLDCGCGDGFWSHLLSEWYDVVGEDPSLGGVMMGAARSDGNPTFYHRSYTESSEVYDVVFCRNMSELARKIDAPFRKVLESLLSRARRLFVYIAYTTPPFNRPHPTSKYLHDPKDVQDCFSLYGSAKTHYENNYFVTSIAKE